MAAGKTQRQAAQDAGSTTPDVTGNGWLKTPKVQKYLAALTQEAVAKANRKTRGTVATLTDAIIVTSDIMRGNLGRFLTEDGDVDLPRIRRAPNGLVKRYETTVRRIAGSEGSAGIEERTTKFELRDSLAAASKLIDYYKPTDPGLAGGQHLHIHLPAEMAAELFRRRMKGELGVGA
jgi:hypothetical protein